MVMNNNSNGNTGAGQLLRPRYFPRQMVTAADLTADQEYFRDRLRRHNRLLHGCGVICGLLARVSTDAETGVPGSCSPTTTSVLVEMALMESRWSISRIAAQQAQNPSFGVLRIIRRIVSTSSCKRS